MKRMPLAVSSALLVVFCAACSSSRNPDQARTQVAFGVKAARMNLWREARFRFERATQNNPNDAMAHNNLAVALEGAGEFDRARVEYLQALQLDQSNQYIQKNYSRFMEFYGKKKKETPKEPAANAKSPAPPPAPSGPTSTTPPAPVAPAPASAPQPPTTPPTTPPPNGEATGGQS